ncbi:transcription factor bHLH121 [Nicotiana tabacum]|uniref:Transcription factor bHLH121 n=2 Tax=Nicotiana TaxID=4085 RepID=A0A1S4CT79_TOBAC|nr:PREDICTED: transcription factor bHLH121-like [Nicotiana sylvestris]XP_016504316.1 PREDICTED: transcription factor bHLH121-like [Nicotiana tabacum]
MDELKCQNSYQSNHIPNPSVSDSTQLPPDSSTKQKPGAELKDSIAARKVQKADREKLRRDRLNEQFTELGNTLDPDRPKNDKASILSDTIQVLKDLTAQVGKLKSEYAALTDESRELTQEKTDLREEKASLKSDIDSLNAQYQQRLRTMYPWAGMDPSMVMRPPSYSYPVPVPLPTGAIPMHPSLQPYPFFGNQNPAAVPNPCSPFVQYMAPSALMEQQPAQQISPVMQSSNRTHGSGRHDSRNKSSDQGESRIEKNEDSNEVATNLELKTPGPESEQELSSGQRISRKLSSKDNSLTDGSSSSRCSSSHSVQALSSNSVVRGKNTDG